MGGGDAIRSERPAINYSKRHVLEGPTINLFKEKPTTNQYAVLCYIVLVVFTLLMSLAAMASAFGVSILIKAYEASQWKRVMASIALAVTAICTTITAIVKLVGTRKKNSKIIRASAYIIIILAVAQALLLGLFVKLKKSDEAIIHKSLTDLMHKVVDNDEASIDLMDITQSELECCGVHGPDNYLESDLNPMRTYRVPLSCCPTYNPHESEFYLNWQKDLCSFNQLYYKKGCLDPILKIHRLTSYYATAFTASLVVLSILVAALAFYLLTRNNQVKQKPTDSKERTMERTDSELPPPVCSYQ